MKLLICTQKVDKNDSVLGFFHRWLEEFAKHCESVVVICLEKGEYHLPENVQVLSLGKNVHISHITYDISILKKMWYMIKFSGYIWKYRKEYERIFVHMNPEYVVLGGWLWKILGKKISLWYVHRQVNLKLRVATFWADKIFSVSPESFRLRSKKVEFVGHGIDTEFFRCDAKKEKTGGFKIISVGRITKIKNLDTLIEAIATLPDGIKRKISVEIIGGPVTEEDKKYLQELKNSVKIGQLWEIVKFIGSVPHNEMINLYCQSDLLVNLCPTGGIDKVVLEAMSCGVPVLVSNQSFKHFFGNCKGQLLFGYNNPKDLADKIFYFINNFDPRLGAYLRQQAVENHNIVRLVEKLLH